MSGRPSIARPVLDPARRGPYQSDAGRVAERSKALVLKTSRRATASWVRIPPLPPFRSNNFLKLASKNRISQQKQSVGSVIDCGTGLKVKVLLPNMLPRMLPGSALNAVYRATG
jgi:hypothetical protein